MRINVAGGTGAGTKPAKREPFARQWRCPSGHVNPPHWLTCGCGCRTGRHAGTPVVADAA